jgi:hypothetical protein
MKVTRVQYTARQDFVEENKKNIDAVMGELRATGNRDVQYAVYLHDDGKTFMHFVHHNAAGAEHLPTSLDAFKRFQSQLRQNLEIAPKVETFKLVQSSLPMF